MSEEAKEPKKDKKRVAGGLFIGMGIGWAMGYLVQGTLVGLGAGFLLFGLIVLTGRD